MQGENITVRTKIAKRVPNEAGAKGKPISLSPLSTEEALRGLLQVKPVRNEDMQKIAPKAEKKSSNKQE